MKLFIDSADIEEIKEAYSYGIIDGITTNPSLIKKAVDKYGKIKIKDYIKKILKIAKNTPVSLEVLSANYKAMVQEANTLYKAFNPVAKNVVIKIPVDPSFGHNDNHFDGVKAIRTLARKKVPVNATLIFTPEQALLAAKAGARYVSPFLGRFDDFIRAMYKMKFKKEDYFPMHGHKAGWNYNGVYSGVDLVAQIVQILENYDTEVLAASIRNVRQLRECALVKADVATVPFKVIKEMVVHKKTEEGMINFTKDIVVEYAEMLRRKR
ncbi:transaldolase [Candidatus Woesearchaeota archaeon]|nr:MAG: transaldolase [Candidatus Woesearchaeota archaeon]